MLTGVKCPILYLNTIKFSNKIFLLTRTILATGPFLLVICRQRLRVLLPNRPPPACCDRAQPRERPLHHGRTRYAFRPRRLDVRHLQEVAALRTRLLWTHERGHGSGEYVGHRHLRRTESRLDAVEHLLKNATAHSQDGPDPYEFRLGKYGFKRFSFREKVGFHYFLLGLADHKDDIEELRVG